MRALLQVRILMVGLVVALTTVAAAPAGAQDKVTGTASYRERIALPPNAVFEAVLQDVSRADAPAVEISRQRIENPGQPPIAFSIPYDRARIDKRLTYVVRTRILVDEQLMFTSDTAHRVLTRGAPATVTVMMRKVGGQATPTGGESNGTLGAHGMLLPATFTGVLPCADCGGIRHHLNLWPDQTYELHRSWIDIDERQDNMGRWSVDPERRMLMLWGAGEPIAHFAILSNQRLRLLDSQGRPIESELSYELARQGALEPIRDLELPLAGMFVYMADAARLTECQTGRSYPVAMEEDYLQLERAYTEARPAPGAPLLATLEGRITERPKMDGEGTEAAVVVRRFVNVWPGETCERNLADASLTNTYWRIVRLGDQEVRAAEGHREPHLLLRAGEPRFNATVGCNQIIGGYVLSGDALRFEAGASTMMACPPPLDRLEQRLRGILTKAAGWRVHGQFLEFDDAKGKPLALFQAVYLH